MDEEELTPQEAVDDPRPDEAQEEVSEPTVTPEDLARELGWSPKEEWRGDETQWKPADKFLKDTVQINRNQRRELKGMEDRIDRLTRSIGTIVDKTREEERAKLLSQHQEAVDMGDHDAALRVSQKIIGLESQPVETGASEFAARNAKWFQKDDVATAVAIDAAEKLARIGASAEAQFAYAERIVRQQFPEHFEEPKTTKPPAQVAEPVGRMAATPRTNRTKGYADLPPEAKKAADEFAKKGISKEVYAQSYWAEEAA